MRRSYKHNRYLGSLGQMQAPIIVRSSNKTKTALLWVGGIAVVGIGMYFVLRRFGIIFGAVPRFASDSVNVNPNQTVTIQVLDGLIQQTGTFTQANNAVSATVSSDRKSVMISGPKSATPASGTYRFEFTLTNLAGREPAQKTITVIVP